MIHKTFQPISRLIFKIALEESLYAQVVMIRWNRIFYKGGDRKKPKINICFKDSLKYKIIGLILILSEFKKISV